MSAVYRNDAKSGQRERQSSLTQDDENVVGFQGQFLLTTFVDEQMQRDGVPHVAGLGQQQTDPQRANMEYMREVIRSITTAIDADVKRRENVDSFISRIPAQAEGETLRGVISKLFEDYISWGKVVSLFYFAYKLCVKAINSVGAILRVIFDFMKDRVVPWVIGEGGWERIIGYVSLSSRQFSMLFMAGVAAAAGVIIFYKYQK